MTWDDKKVGDKLYKLADMVNNTTRSTYKDSLYFLGVLDSIRVMINLLTFGTWEGVELDYGDNKFVIKDNKIIRKEETDG